ncbi:hypothetical protein [Hyphomonas johnsonii]|nr:hypothetical protein [Hyphomonas johnsonii]
MRIYAIGIAILMSGLQVSAEEWPIKRFEVVALEPAGHADMIAGTEKIPVLVTRMLRSVNIDPDQILDFSEVELDPETKTAMERFLNDAAGLYESWGFGPPSLEPVVELENGAMAHRVYLVKNVIINDTHYSGMKIGSCEGMFSERIILLSADAILSAKEYAPDGTVLNNGRITVNGYATLAHELFHAVQHGSVFASRCSKFTGSVGDWITEGQADAIAWDAVRRLRNANPDVTPGKSWGLRDYQFSLPIPSVRPPETDGYRTSSFWRYLAETASGGTPGAEPQSVDYSFMASMLATPAVARDCNETSDAPCRAELFWLDRNLRTQFGKPLRDLYALFMQAYGQYDTARVRDVTHSWRGEAFPSCYPIVFRKTDDPEFGNAVNVHHVQVDTFNANATTCFLVTPVGYDSDVRVNVRVDDSDGHFSIQDLAAGIEGPPYRSENAKVERGRNDGDPRMTSWEFDFEGKESTMFFLSNVADNPAKTSVLDGLPVTLMVVKEYGRMSKGKGAGVPGIEQPMRIEFDKFGPKDVVRTTTEIHQKAGFLRPCMVRLTMRNSKSDVAIEVAMDHEGPILPGTYDIAYLEHGQYQPTDEHPDEFVVSFGLGKDGHYIGNRQIAYGGQVGTVEITAFSPDIMAGRVRVLGKKELTGYLRKEQRAQYDAAPESMSVESVFSVLPRVHPGGKGLLANDNCFDPDPSKWYAASSPDIKAPPPAPTDAGDTSSPRRDGDDPVEEREAEVSAPPTTSSDAGKTSTAPGSATSGTISALCRPLYFTETQSFNANPELPFRFNKPVGWQAELLDGPRSGRISSPDYPDGGIEYNIRWLVRRSDNAQSEAMRKILGEVVGTVNYGAESVPVYSYQMGDTLNTYVTLPVGDRFIDVELLFKGRRSCDMKPVEDLRALFLNSFQAK